MKTPKTYEEYCLDFPEETQEILENLKNFIQNLLPESEICINYGIPTFKMKGKKVNPYNTAAKDDNSCSFFTDKLIKLINK